MSRYIDIDRLKPQQFENSEVELGVLAYDYEAVQSEPYIDIVRCSECKHWRAYETWSECERWTGDPYDTAKTNADDFCSYGERSSE